MEKLQTLRIGKKDYVTVNERIKAFRTHQEWMGWTLKTILHNLTDQSCTMEAQILDKEGRLIANGFASEDKAKSNINATSYVENCETSAWGRALGNLGIGIDEAICSAQELLNKMNAEKELAEKIEKDENYLTLLSDMDAAETLDQLRGSVMLSMGQPYEAKIREKANKIAIIRGWVNKK